MEYTICVLCDTFMELRLRTISGMLVNMAIRRVIEYNGDWRSGPDQCSCCTPIAVSTGMGDRDLVLFISQSGEYIAACEYVPI